MKGKHDFVVTTFLRPTYCDCCSRLLWGLSRQGLKCTVCEANIHKSCQNLVLVSCHGPSIKNLSLFEKEKRDDFKDFKEPLNLLTTTPKNFTRFVSRLGPIVEAQEEILRVLEWSNPGKSSAVLLFYILLCLYPWLVIFFPPAYILYVLISKDPGENQAQYMKNMQFIQNHMKMGSDVFDFLNLQHEKLRNSKVGNLILLYSILGSIVLSIGFCYIPIKINWIMLILGVPTLLSHTVTFRYFSFLCKRMFITRLEKLYTKGSPKLFVKAGEYEKFIKIFENQRWWAGLGWIPFLLKNERSGWSDEAGTSSLSHIHDYELPESYRWKEDEWSIYEDWSGDVGVDGQGEKLEICNIIGWVYTDNSWQGPHPRITLGSYTRRRCWIRTMEPLDGKIKQS